MPGAFSPVEKAAGNPEVNGKREGLTKYSPAFFARRNIIKNVYL
jgi:hypothetical protein